MATNGGIWFITLHMMFISGTWRGCLLRCVSVVCTTTESSLDGHLGPLIYISVLIGLSSDAAHNHEGALAKVQDLTA